MTLSKQPDDIHSICIWPKKIVHLWREPCFSLIINSLLLIIIRLPLKRRKAGTECCFAIVYSFLIPLDLYKTLRNTLRIMAHTLGKFKSYQIQNITPRYE